MSGLLKIEDPDATTRIDFIDSAYYKRYIVEAEFAKSLEIERRQLATAFYLGYTCVEQMDDHLHWLETRFPEGAEL
jgi:hypothetical protein